MATLGNQKRKTIKRFAIKNFPEMVLEASSKIMDKNAYHNKNERQTEIYVDLLFWAKKSICQSSEQNFKLRYLLKVLQIKSIYPRKTFFLTRLRSVLIFNRQRLLSNDNVFRKQERLK